MMNWKLFVGIVLIVLGAIHDHLGLLILENESPADKLTLEFQSRYGHLTSNPAAFTGLAAMVSPAANQELVEVVTTDLM